MTTHLQHLLDFGFVPGFNRRFALLVYRLVHSVNSVREHSLSCVQYLHLRVLALRSNHFEVGLQFNGVFLQRLSERF